MLLRYPKDQDASEWDRTCSGYDATGILPPWRCLVELWGLCPGSLDNGKISESLPPTILPHNFSPKAEGLATKPLIAKRCVSAVCPFCS